MTLGDHRNNSPRICLLVLGMHRSGTSAVTRLLSLAGATLPRSLIGAGEGNERGHWEPASMVQLHDRFLAELGSSWYDWRRLDIDRLPASRRNEIKERIRRGIHQNYGSEPLIVVKEPRICRFEPLFIEVLQEANYDVRVVLPFRNPLEVSASLARRDGAMSRSRNPEVDHLVWLRHLLDAEAATRSFPRCFISYDSLLANWGDAFSRLCQSLQVTFPVKTSEIQQDVNDFLASELRHHTHTTEELSLQLSARHWVTKAFEATQILEHAPSSDAAMATLDLIRGELEGAEPSLDRMTQTYRDLQLSLAEFKLNSDGSQSHQTHELAFREIAKVYAGLRSS